MTKIQIVSIVFSLIFMLIIFELVRKRKLKEEYSIIWFFAGFVICVFSANTDLLETLAEIFGVFYAPSVLIPIVIFCGVVISCHFSIVLSKMTKNNTKLAQEVALLKHKLEQIEKKTTNIQ